MVRHHFPKAFSNFQPPNLQGESTSHDFHDFHATFVPRIIMYNIFIYNISLLYNIMIFIMYNEGVTNVVRSQYFTRAPMERVGGRYNLSYLMHYT